MGGRESVQSGLQPHAAPSLPAWLLGNTSGPMEIKYSSLHSVIILNSPLEGKKKYMGWMRLLRIVRRDRKQ